MTDSTPVILRDLGDGLILRRSTPADAEALADFNKMIHRDQDVVEPDETVAAWTRDLLTRAHPTFGAGDFTIVEETKTGKIVSTLNTISQTWSYGGIPFGVGRPELVGTDPEFRRRGLVRAQFDVIHAWSAERRELVQAITGIPYYYRQFGYEMALVLGGGRTGLLSAVPKLKEGETEPYRLRPATEEDLSFIVALDSAANRRWLIACERDAAQWRYEIAGKSETNVNRLAWAIIEAASGAPIGVIGHAWRVWEGNLGVAYVEVAAGVSWLAAAPSILRYLGATALAYAERDGKPVDRLNFWLAHEHPFFAATQDRLPQIRRPYAWYLRVADLPGFLRHVAPVLEERLARSIAVGHTGELKLSFYRSGVRLAFESGRLTAVEPWLPTHSDGGSAAFPSLSFLQLLFGYRSLEELRGAFPDCWADGDTPRALLGILFPKQPSDFWPVA
ncbi:MAG: GNAT family N-acetyltransferase [Anaerolineae bacterium]|nr:GNAT family N-acetyltransferase [Anaerolineae bacterium]